MYIKLKTIVILNLKILSKNEANYWTYINPKTWEELNDNTFIRKTNYSNHDIHIVDFKNQPNTTLEIGRLRELSFRKSGGGTGKSFDLDEYDQRDEAYYKQLIVWDPDEKQIIGGYRFLLGSDIVKSKKYNHTATNHLFNFSTQFLKNIFPYTIELGRSFVQPAYQPSSGNRKSIFSLDNLWDGIRGPCRRLSKN